MSSIREQKGYWSQPYFVILSFLSCSFSCWLWKMANSLGSTLTTPSLKDWLKFCRLKSKFPITAHRTTQPHWPLAVLPTYHVSLPLNILLLQLLWEGCTGLLSPSVLIHSCFFSPVLGIKLRPSPSKHSTTEPQPQAHLQNEGNNSNLTEVDKWINGSLHY